MAKPRFSNTRKPLDRGVVIAQREKELSNLRARQLSVMLAADVKAELYHIAKRRGITLAQLSREIITENLINYM